MKALAWWLLLIGGLNWLLFGLFGKDIFGLLGMDMTSWIPRIVYLLVGISALYWLFAKKQMM